MPTATSRHCFAPGDARRLSEGPFKSGRWGTAEDASTAHPQGWLRGRDLNPRPSGYECFYLVDVHALMFLMMLICADLFRSSMGDRFA